MSQPRRVLVTGGTGFVGLALLPALRAALPGASIIPAEMDVTDAASVTAEVGAVRPDACVHLAAVSAVPAARQDPDLAWRVNLDGTLLLARALKAAVPGCTLLYVSTADAYGRSFATGQPVTEDTPLAPMNTYSETKAAADLALGEMAKDGLRVVRVRPFNHTGPGQSPDFVLSAFARQIARIGKGLQPPFMQVGALDPHRDFLDVRDVCQAYVRCVLAGDVLPPGAILNLSSGTSRQIGAILAELLAIAGVQATIQTDASRLRPTDIPVASGDSSAARQLLGWAPQIPWHQTLSDLLADWRVRVTAEAA